ncbi:MAG: NADH-quinone oxidoreductase subunit NuoB [Chloroflexaceae bacterium]|nr:NADH-quinone oxidoreductase subunit NuoB [Chloroflexaceae bacterium]
MGIEEKAANLGIVTTTLETVVNWGRTNAMWPLTFGLACCAIEMMSAQASNYDLSRFGMEIEPPLATSGRPDDCLGACLAQNGSGAAALYDQMSDPKWVIAMGDCASCGGVFNNYAIVQGVDEVVPVDVYVAGCPPRPEALIDGIMRLHEKVMKEKISGTSHNADRTTIRVEQEQQDGGLIQVT